MTGVFTDDDWGDPVDPPAGGVGAGMQQQHALALAGVIAGVLTLVFLIGLGSWDAVGWIKALLIAVIVGLAAFGTVYWLALHPPQPRRASAPDGDPAAAPAPAATTNHTFIAIMVGCGTTVVSSVFLTVVAARFTEDGAFRTMAFLAPYIVAGGIATKALFKRGT